MDTFSSTISRRSRPTIPPPTVQTYRQVTVVTGPNHAVQVIIADFAMESNSGLWNPALSPALSSNFSPIVIPALSSVLGNREVPIIVDSRDRDSRDG